MSASTPQPRSGTMLRRTVSFHEVYNPAPGRAASAAPVDEPEADDFFEPDTTVPDEPTSTASAESSFAYVRRTVHNKGPYKVKKDKATMRANARAKVHYDLQLSLDKFKASLRLKRRAHLSHRDALEAIAAELAEDEALQAECLAAEAAHREGLPWSSTLLVPPSAFSEKRKRTDDDDALDEELSTIKRSRFHDDPLPSLAGASPPVPDPSMTTSRAPSTPPPVPATSTDSGPTVARTETMAQPIPESVPSTPAIAASAASTIAFTLGTSPSATLSTETLTRIETPPRRRRSNGTSASGSPSASAAAVASSNNSRVRRRASAPVLTIYQGPEPEPEEEPEPDSSPSPRKGKRKRRSSLTAKENRGVRRNAANDPVQN